MLNSQSRLRRMQGLSPGGRPVHRIDPPIEADSGDSLEMDVAPWLDFARDCGAGEGLAIRIEAAGAPPRDVAVPSGMALVGRHPQCSVQLPGSQVADKHLLALFLQKEFFVCDLGSPGGTWVDSRRVTSGWLPAGTALRVGDSRIVLEGPVAAEGGAEEAESPALADELWLTSARGPADRRYRLEKAVTIFGRDARCRVRISNRSVSRFHCVLVRTSSGVWVADLASREGIRVNGQRVGVARIDDDCELTVGATSLLLQRGRDVDDEPPPEFAPQPAGQMSEEFVRELLAEFRKAQRETIADVGALLREVLRAGAQPAQTEAILQRLENRLAKLPD